MLRRINFRHDFAKKQQQESKDNCDYQELQNNRSSEIDYPCKEEIAEHNDGNVHKIIGNEDGCQQSFGITQKASVVFIRRMIIVLNVVKVASRQLKERNFGFRHKARGKQQQYGQAYSHQFSCTRSTNGYTVE